MRSTRDLLRRRTYLMRKRAELLVHVQHTNSQYNLPEIGKKIAYRANRSGVAERFSDPAVQTSIAADLSLIDFYDTLLNQLELFITRQAKQQDHHSFYLLRSVPGIGKILALTILYEIHDIARFPRVRSLSPTAVSSSAVANRPGKTMGSPAKRSATFTSSGPSRKRLSCFSATTRKDRNWWLAWSANMEKPKPSPSWLTSWPAPSISSYEGRKPLT